MKRDQLEELGYIVRAELADEDIDDYLYVVENQDGDLEVLHFYRNGLYLVPTVEIYFFSSFRKRERNKLRKQPQDFLETFDRRIMFTVPDLYMNEEEWIKDKKFQKGY